MTRDKYDKAIELANSGIPVFPLATNNTVPLKGSHGYKDATTDTDQIAAWFNNEQRLNVGMALKPALLLVVDLDRQHASGFDGITAFNQLNKRYGNGQNPLFTYVLKTPHGGIHLFYKIPAGVSIPSKPLANFKSQLSNYKGIDIVTNGTPAVMTTTTIGEYEAITATKVTSLTDAVECPNWLLSLLTSVPTYTQQSITPPRKTWTGELLDSLFEPSADMGNRNVYLTSVCGKLLRTGSSSPVAYKALQTANNHLSTPLPDKEVDQMFRSVLNRELEKAR